MGKPILSHVVQDADGDVQSVAVSIREIGGAAFSGTLYDSTGAVVSYPPSSNNLGLLQIFTDRARRVEVQPLGSTAWTPSKFDDDPANHPIWLENSDGGVAINTGVNSANAAFTAAIVAAQLTGQKIKVGLGTYLCTAPITIPDGVWIDGSGRGTILKHADNTDASVIHMYGATKARLSNLRVDGNYSNNNNISTGYDGVEIRVGGVQNVVEDVEVYNFNAHAFEVSGSYCVYRNLRAIGPTPTPTYPPTTGGSASRNYGGVYGFLVAGTSVSDNNTWENLYATGCRSAGIYVGGTDCMVLYPQVDNCHLGYYPDDGTGVYPGSSGGGQLALTITTAAGGGSQIPTRITIVGPKVSGGAVGTSAGIEIGAGDSITIFDPQCIGVPNGGISINSATRVKVIGGGVINSSTSTGVSIIASTHVTLDGVDIQTTTTGIDISGASEDVSILNCGFHANTTNVSNTSTATRVIIDNYRLQSGTAPTIAYPGRTPLTAVCSSGLALTTTPTDVTGMSLSLTPGKWKVDVSVLFSIAGAGDVGPNFEASLVTSGGTATITHGTATILYSVTAQPVVNTCAKSWYVNVTATTTCKVQGSKSAGAGTSTIAATYSNMVATYLGMP